MACIAVDKLSVTYRKSEPRPTLTGRAMDLFSPLHSDVHALREISFRVEQGECVGYIGPNGSGKTTTIKVLSGVLRPSGGSIRVLDHEPIRREPGYLRRIGLIMGAKSQLWPDLPAADTFAFLKEAYGLRDKVYRDRVEHLTQLFGVEKLIHTPVRLLSQGERVRMQLICSIIHGPDVLFMDEPTFGLDIWAQGTVHDFISSAVSNLGTTVLLTSHNLADIDRLCDRIVVLNEGCILYDGQKTALKSQFQALKRVSVNATLAASIADHGVPAEIWDERPDETTLIMNRDDIAVIHRISGPDVSIAVETVPLEYIVRKLVGQ